MTFPSNVKFKESKKINYQQLLYIQGTVSAWRKLRDKIGWRNKLKLKAASDVTDKILALPALEEDQQQWQSKA